MKTYREVNGTSYDARTPEEVIRVLESARQNRTRLHISLGDTATGKDWLEEFESHGYVGRSMGPVKVPLLIANRRSLGGGAILDHCVVRIRTAAGGRVLYQHPAYHHGSLEIRQKADPVELPDGRLLTVDVIRDGELHASFESINKARRWVQKLGVVAPIAG
ncbi:MAG: hypothetical protein AB7I37_06470 [Pirellulales bacterium]